MADYKLSFTAKEIDSKLAQVEKAVIDFDELGLTGPVLDIFMAGGGTQKLDVDHNVFWRLFPANGDYSACVHIGLDAFYLIPSYTAVNYAGGVTSTQIPVRLGKQNVGIEIELNFLVTLTAKPLILTNDDGSYTCDYNFGGTTLTVTVL